jgi:WD40 repeat protein
MLWNLETGEAIHTFTGHTAEICALSLSSDSKRAISASDDKTLILWDLEPFMKPQVL